VTDGDEHRAYAILRSQSDTERFFSIDERGVTSGFWSRFLKFPNKKALRAPDRWKIEKKAEMACDAKSPRMGESLAVDHDDIGDGVEVVPCFKHSRRLPERKKPRNVREDYLRDGCPTRNFNKLGKLQDHDAGVDDIGTLVERNIAARNEANRFRKPFRDHLRTQSLLNGNRLLRCHVPPVKLLGGIHCRVPRSFL
jgi:hypothetical protein